MMEISKLWWPGDQAKGQLKMMPIHVPLAVVCVAVT